ncbi:MAG: Ig-like domain-containing protein [Treponema sp.]|nr:Ig-like domain-containing protein [Treponema sp.]
MKRFIGILAALAATVSLLSLAACSNGSDKVNPFVPTAPVNGGSGGGSQQQTPAGSISYATTTVSKTTAAEAFTNTLTKTGDGTVSYASSKTDVAEVNASTGLVTIKGAGETTITATVADSDTYTYATKTASYTLTITQAIGTKAPTEAKAVGDIVFSDGSATAYTSGLTLTDEQKSKAVAVIFYAGSASDTLGAKTLGVGLRNATGLAWARHTIIETFPLKTDSAEGWHTNITAIRCTPSTNLAGTATFTGDLDGSDNWKALCDAVSDEGTSGNYPAWEWVNAYATENSLSGSYASGWYLPTLAELSMLYRVKDTVNSALEKAGGTKIADEVYWSSSQVASNEYFAWYVWFGAGNLVDLKKDVHNSVCTVRAF